MSSLIGFKITQTIETGIVYAPYIPIYTSVIMHTRTKNPYDGHPYLTEEEVGFCTRLFSKKWLEKRYCVKVCATSGRIDIRLKNPLKWPHIEDGKSVVNRDDYVTAFYFNGRYFGHRMTVKLPDKTKDLKTLTYDVQDPKGLDRFWIDGLRPLARKEFRRQRTMPIFEE